IRLERWASGAQHNPLSGDLIRPDLGLVASPNRRRTLAPERASTSLRAHANLESPHEASLKNEKYEILDKHPLGAGCPPGRGTAGEHGVRTLADHPGRDGGRGLRADTRGGAQSLERVLEHGASPRRRLRSASSR